MRRLALGRLRERGLRVRRAVPYGSDPAQRVDVWGEGPATVLLLHGGGWVEGTRRDFASLAPAFARAGVRAVAADYRLAPAHPWPAALEDVCGALTMIPSLGGDPRRVVAWGHSAGGHLALMAARQPGVDLAGVVALGAPADLRRLSPEEQVHARRVFGDVPLERCSPVSTPCVVPTLLVHGTSDKVCDIAGARALAAEGGNVSLIEVSGGDHGLRLPPHRCLPARRQAFEWVLDRLRVRG